MKLFGNTKPDKHKKHAAGAEAAQIPHHEAKKKQPSVEEKRKKALRRGLTVLGVIALVVVGVVVAYSIWEKPPDIANNKPPKETSTPTPRPTPGPTEPAVTEPVATPDDNDPDIDPFDGALDTERDDGIYTFLLVGRDHESNSTDTILVGRIDTNEHTIDAINIPRDTMINIGWADTPKKINTVYPGYFNSGRDAVEGLKTHVKNLIGFEVDCYAVVNLSVVEKVIDEIGGVYFDVPINMDYDDGAQHFHVHLKKGYQLLNGYQALGVFRFRYGNYGQGTYPGGDMQRIGVQQDLLKSIASQVLSLGNIPNLANIIQLCLDNVETDLDARNMAFFARQFLMCSAEDINFHVAPIGSSRVINNISYVCLDINEWLEMVNECINPYRDPVTTANVNILICTSSTSFMSTTGGVAGGEGSFACNEPGCTLRFSHHSPGLHVREGDEPETETSPPPETNPGGETAPPETTPGGETTPPETTPEPPPPAETPPPGVGGDAPVEITLPTVVE